MSDSSETARFINAKRRGFLQGAAVASGAAVTGAVASPAIDVDDMQAPEAIERKGYELTDHIRKYYKRARF